MSIDSPSTLDEFQERFGVDALSFALRQIVVNVQNVVRTAVKGTKNKDGIRDLPALQEMVDAYKPGAREVSPASVRGINRKMKEVDEESRIKIAAVVEQLAADPKLLEKLAVAAAKKKAEAEAEA